MRVHGYTAGKTLVDPDQGPSQLGILLRVIVGGAQDVTDT